jgi:hypothetical protein
MPYNTAVTIIPMEIEIIAPPLRTNACTWVPISTQHIITEAIALGKRRMKAFKNANRSVPNGLKRMTAPYPILKVRTHARKVRFNDRNPIWNILTAPEIKVFRIQSSGATIPVIIQAMMV